jgi:FKBP-type peptidyl-prolyl cis-trans isomerase 2
MDGRQAHSSYKGETMAQAKRGDQVRVHYNGTLENGTVFSSTYKEQEPFEFTIGKGNVLPNFAEALIGMSEGETKTISIPPENAYGHHRNELVFEVKRSELPEVIELALGKRLSLRLRDGTMTIAAIKKITEDTVLLDANDPLAGETLKFEIELLNIL